jgi:hypothetical protein
MGEKGNDPARLAAATMTSAIEPTVIERVTTTTTSTVVDAGGDVLSKVRDKAVDHASDEIFERARDRVTRKEPAAEASAAEDVTTETGDEQPRG